MPPAVVDAGGPVVREVLEALAEAAREETSAG
jgi:hypothetical protein